MITVKAWCDWLAFQWCLTRGAGMAKHTPDAYAAEQRSEEFEDFWQWRLPYSLNVLFMAVEASAYDLIFNPWDRVCRRARCSFHVWRRRAFGPYRDK